MSGIVGTPHYVAPEVVSGVDYNEKVDVWSVGVILYKMLSGVPRPSTRAREIFESVLRANLRFPRSVFGSVSSQAKDLLRRMLCNDVSRRASVDVDDEWWRLQRNVYARLRRSMFQVFLSSENYKPYAHRRICII